MKEILTGDLSTPEEYLEQRRGIIRDAEAGLVDEAEALQAMANLVSANPTANAAYERNLRELGDID
jgi:ABC-type sugar transport system substrate-binding protein